MHVNEANYNSTNTAVYDSLVEALETYRNTPVDRAAVMARLERLGWLLDDAFTIPGTRIKLGWDSIIGLVPVVGDGLTTLLSAYFLWEANRLGVSKWTQFRMLGNVAWDFIVGLVPLVGDLFDITWRANRKNVVLLQRELNRSAN